MPMSKDDAPGAKPKQEDVQSDVDDRVFTGAERHALADEPLEPRRLRGNLVFAGRQGSAVQPDRREGNPQARMVARQHRYRQGPPIVPDKCAAVSLPMPTYRDLYGLRSGPKLAHARPVLGSRVAYVEHDIYGPSNRYPLRNRRQVKRSEV